MNITSLINSTFIPFEGGLVFIGPDIPILVNFLQGSLFSFAESDNMILGNNPGGKNCKILGNQCSAIGLNTQAGFSAPCTFINTQTAIIYGLNDGDFYGGCQVTFYNLTGGKDETIITAIVHNASTDGTDTYLVFSQPITDHLTGFVALNIDTQANSDGTNTIASGKDSYAGGYGAVSDLPSKFSRSDSYISTSGDSQYSFVSVSCITIDATPTVMKVGNKYLKIRNNMSYMFTTMIGGRKANGAEVGLFLRYGIITNNDGTVSLDDDPSTLGVDRNGGGWAVAITADNINKSLQIQVTGDTDEIHWKTRCDFIEIG